MIMVVLVEVTSLVEVGSSDLRLFPERKATLDVSESPQDPMDPHTLIAL